MKIFNCVKRNEFRLISRCYLQKVFRNHIFNTYIYKNDITLNNLYCLICHKTQPNQTKSNQTRDLVNSHLLALGGNIRKSFFWKPRDTWVTIILGDTSVSGTVTVPHVPSLISMTVTFTFHNIFSSQARSRYFNSEVCWNGEAYL